MAQGVGMPERWLAPLDWLRAALLRQLGPHVRQLLRNRAARVRALGAGAVASSLLLAVWAPLGALSVTPLLFGVPHLLGDVRYLVIRQDLHRRPVFAGIALCLVVGATGAPLVWGAGALALAALGARAPVLPRLAVVSLSVALGALAARYERHASVLFAHTHNLIAIGVWCAWARSRRALVPALLAALLASLALWLGLFDAALTYSLGTRSTWSAAGGTLEHSLTFATDPLWALRALAFFAFAQSLHYAIWLRLLPEEDRARPGVRSFTASYRALVKDVGTVLPVGALLATLALLACAAQDLPLARDGYLRFAAFHGPLELSLLVLLALERRTVLRENTARER